MAKYNFTDNILKLSRTNKVKNLPKEWIYFAYTKRYDRVNCICCRKIVNVYIFWNKDTHKFIYVGSGCKKKLSLSSKKAKFHGIFNNTRGEYTNINNLTIYSNIVENYFKNNIFSDNNFNNLYVFLYYLECIQPEYQADILHIIYDLLLKKLDNYDQNKFAITEFLISLKKYQSSNLNIKNKTKILINKIYSKINILNSCNTALSIANISSEEAHNFARQAFKLVEPHILNECNIALDIANISYEKSQKALDHVEKYKNFTKKLEKKLEKESQLKRKKIKKIIKKNIREYIINLNKTDFIKNKKIIALKKNHPFLTNLDKEIELIKTKPFYNPCFCKKCRDCNVLHTIYEDIINTNQNVNNVDYSNIVNTLINCI